MKERQRTRETKRDPVPKKPPSRNLHKWQVGLELETTLFSLKLSFISIVEIVFAIAAAVFANSTIYYMRL